MAQSTHADFVIVGGGLAGLVIGRRLSELLASRVTILEAGDALDPARSNINMPLYARSLQAPSSDVIWKYESVPQEALGGRTVDIPAGKCVGGSSSVNYCIWTRGNKLDYDRLAELAEDQSWSYDALLPYFRKTERFISHSSPVDSTVRGTQGLITVTPVNDADRSYVWRGRAERSHIDAGFQYLPDVNTGSTVGFGDLQENSISALGGRQSAVKYVFDRPSNLQIIASAAVEKVIFEAKVAVGVQTVTGTVYRADKEVIICAGALRSPVILHLSGIGPPELLKRIQIPALVSLPGVGRNLWDHPILHTRWRVKPEFRGGTMDDLRDPKKLAKALEEFKATKSGPFSGVPWEFTAWKCHAKALQHMVSSDQALDANYKEYLLNPELGHSQYLTTYAYANGDVTGADAYISFSAIAVTPTSRGTVEARSADPTVLPSVDPQYLATDVDRAIMRDAVKTLEAIASSPAWKEVLDAEIDPGGAVGFSAAEIDRKLRDLTVTGWHYGGTCAMAPKDSASPLGVVDSQCRVYGVDKLRVIDASVLSVPISANTQVATYCLAEKMADVIKAAHAN